MLVPKRLYAHEIFQIYIFTALYALSFDIVIGQMIDMYDYGPTEAIDGIDFLLELIVNPCIAITFLNFLPKRMWVRVFYMCGWITLLMLWEYAWLKYGCMRYKTWKYWYSLISYPFLLTSLILQLRWYQHLFKKHLWLCEVPFGKGTDRK